MIAMRFYSDLFHGIVDTIRFLGIDYTPNLIHRIFEQGDNALLFQCHILCIYAFENYAFNYACRMMDIHYEKEEPGYLANLKPLQNSSKIMQLAIRMLCFIQESF